MLRSVTHKFYLIGGLLILSFLIGYAQLAFFLRHETQSATRGQKAVFLEREIRSLRENFFEMRLWEKALFSQEHPEADKKFGQLLAELLDWRQKGDYDNIFDYDQESVLPLFPAVEEMLELIEKTVQEELNGNIK